MHSSSKFLKPCDMSHREVITSICNVFIPECIMLYALCYVYTQLIADGRMDECTSLPTVDWTNWTHHSVSFPALGTGEITVCVIRHSFRHSSFKISTPLFIYPILSSILLLCGCHFMSIWPLWVIFTWQKSWFAGR